MSDVGNKLKILFFCTHLSKGGAEKHFARLIATLNPQKFEKIVVTSRADMEYASLLEESNIELIDFGITSKSSLLTLMKSIVPLKNVINSVKPDVIMSTMDMVNYISHLAQKMAVHKCSSYYLVQASLKNSLKFERNLLKSFLSKVLPKVYENADSVIVLSEGIKNELIEDFVSDRIEHVKVIPNIGLSDNVLENTHELRMPFSLVCCGRLVKVKGFDIILRSFALSKLKFPETRLTIIGDGPEMSNLIELSKDLKVFDDVEFAGFVENPEYYFKRSQIFILASFYEGFGNVIVEAMGSGTAIIATDCPYGPAEIITDGKNGILVPIDDPKTMSDAIIRLFTDNNSLQLLAQNGRLRSSDFTPQNIALKYEEALLTSAI